MMTTLPGIAAIATLLLAVFGLLRLAESRQLRREARYARQIALTDAIHRELGAVAAPTVRKRPKGGWVVSMMVPLDRPATVATLLRITDRVFGAADRSGTGRYEVVLTHRPSGPEAEASGAEAPAAERTARLAA